VKDNVWITKGKATSFSADLSASAGMSYQTPLGDVKVSASRDGIGLELDSKGRMLDIGIMFPYQKVEGYWKVGMHLRM